MLIRLLEALPTAVVRVADDLNLTGPRILAKQHELRFSVGFAALDTLKVLEVAPVHGENIVELVKVGVVYLRPSDLSADFNAIYPYLSCMMNIVCNPVILKSGDGPVVWFFANVVRAWTKLGSA